jgi:outer membrane protein insertion porin family
MGKLRIWLSLVGLVLFVAVVSVGARAADNIFTGEPIANIRIEGTQRIEPESVLSYMQLAAGDPFSADRVDKALKNLYATGLFADVTFHREGGDLVVVVVENPIINRLAFEGNDHINDETLDAEVQLRPRTVYTQTRVQADAKRILDIYRRSGRFAATVDPKVIKLDQNRVDLVFEIHEGDITKVARIDFVGNKVFSDSELRSEILTRESAWYRFFSSSDTYDPDRLTVDRESLRNFYLREGYADFHVVSAIAELSPNRDAFFITFTVEEGERYRFGKIGITTTLKNLDPETLRDQLVTDEGDWYNAAHVEKSIANITDALGNMGYAFVDVRPRVDRDRENKIINLTYEIQEGPRVYVDRINITGNTRTLDKVIRREFRLVEGDAYNTSKVRRTQQRIQNLGFFSKVDIKNVPSDSPDKTNIDVTVEEQSTGEISFGLGFSTSEGPLGNIGISEHNLLGAGKDLRLDFQLSGVHSQLNLSYTDPYFLDLPLSAGIDLFRVVTETGGGFFSSSGKGSFSEDDLGGGLRAGYDISEYLRQTWRYTFTRSNLNNISNDAAEAIKDQEGVTYSSVIGQELVYDRRNSRADPSEGYYIRLRNDVAGLGGDTFYVRSRLGAGYYYPISERTTLGLVGDIGYIQGLGQGVRVNDAFFIGSSNFRGFAPSGIGPRDNKSHDALGGNKYAVGTVEYSFPLPLPDEYPVRGRVFTDFGTLFDTSATKSEDGISDSKALRLSAGVGVTWKSPFGPLAVDLGYPILKQSYDKTQIFRFSVGTQF